jgi:hypothetical protein
MSDQIPVNPGEEPAAPMPAPTPEPFAAEQAAAPVSQVESTGSPVPVAETPVKIGPAPQSALLVVPAIPQADPPPAPQSQFQPQSQPQPSSWAKPGWLALGLAMFLSMCLSVTATLGLLAAVNHGLSYASPADVRALQAQVDTLQGRVDAQEQDLAGLRSRLETVEKLAGRTNALEQAAANIKAELDKRTADLDTLRTALSDAQKQVEQVVTQSKAFEKFISGLSNLMKTLQLDGSTTP